MSKIDYTEIRDDRIRGEICRLMSEMLDDPDEYGIYPTSRFMWKMETFILAENERPRKPRTRHDGDCTIYASLVNDCPEAGVCTCGYGYECVRRGDRSEMYSDERQAAEAVGKLEKKRDKREWRPEWHKR